MMQSQQEFAGTALVAALTAGAILFGVFGFLYTISAQLKAQATPQNRKPLDDAYKLTILCRVIAGVMGWNTLLVVISLIVLNLQGVAEIVLGIGLAASAVATSLIAFFLAFRLL